MFQGLWKHFWLARLFFKMNEEAVSGWTDEVQAWRTISNDITSSLCLRPLHQPWWQQQQQVIACRPCPLLAVPHTGSDLDGLWDTSAATAQRRYQRTLAWILHAAMMNVCPWVSGFAYKISFLERPALISCLLVKCPSWSAGRTHEVAVRSLVLSPVSKQI